jgi:hypothetical protein
VTRFHNLAGQVFGRWSVLSKGEDYIYPSTGKTAVRWTCVCVCGKEGLVHSAHLKNGTSVSCGCYNIEQSFKHGLSGLRAYNAFHHMHKRCSDKATAKDKEYYFDKGIVVCDRWSDVVLFVEDMGECPEGFELERLESSLGYFPENCVWADEQRQAENRKTFKSNTSGRTGVSFDQKLGKWRVYLYKYKVKYVGGNYTNFESAVAARELLELEHLGYIKED